MKRTFLAMWSLVSVLMNIGGWMFLAMPVQAADLPLTKKVAFVGDSQSTNLVCPTFENAQLVTDSQRLMETTVNKIPRVLKTSGVETIAAKCDVGRSTSWMVANNGSYIRGLPMDLDAVIIFGGGNDCNGLPATCAECSNHTTNAPALLNLINERRPKKIIWFTTFWVDQTAVDEKIHICANHIYPAYLPTLASQFPNLTVINGWELTTDGIPRSAGDPHYKNTEYYYPVLSPRLSAKIAQVIGAPAPTIPSSSPTPGGTSGSPAAGAPGTFGAGTSLDVQCAGDLDPVLPVKLGIAVGGVSEVNGLTEYINVVYRYMTAIVLVATIIMITYGGFRYLLSATPAGISDGKSIIQDGLIGMVLVLSAYVILNTINPALTVLQFTRPPESIRCAAYLANLGRSFNGATLNTNITGTLTNPISMRGDNEWDPLDFRHTYGDPAKKHIGNRCTETLGNDDCATGEECVDMLEFFQAINNTVITGSNTENPAIYGSLSTLFTGENAAQICSDGKELYDPCDDNFDCQNNMICSFGWKVCILPTGNEPGSPCNILTGDTGCTAGYSCVLRQRNNSEATVVAPNLAVCTKKVPSILHADISTVYSLEPSAVPENKRCDYHRECETDGAKCIPNQTSEMRVCINNEPNTDGAPCAELHGSTSVTEGYFPCDGTGQACVYCPSSGSRVWTKLRSDDTYDVIGQCKPAALVEQTCATN